MAPLGASASAPDLGAAKGQAGHQLKDRARLQSLLNKATGGDRSALGQRLAPLRPVGGAPRSLSAAHIGAAGGNASASAGGRPLEVSASPSRSISAGSLPMRGQSSPVHKERASAYVRKLTGQDGTGGGPQDWRLVQELDAVDCVLQEEQARRQLAAHKEHLRDWLTSQREDVHRRKTDNRAEQRRWQHKLQADADAFYQEQADKREADRQAQRLLDQQRAELLEVTRRCREAERQRDLAIEREMAERSVAARKIEVAKDTEKRKRHQAQLMSLQKERQEAAESKREKKRQEAIQDVEIMKKQQDVMDRQERDRSAKQEKIREDQLKRMAQYEASAGNELMEQERKDEARMKTAADERSRKEQQQHQDKQQRKAQDKLERKEAMQAQMKEQKDRRARERDEELRLAKKMHDDAAAAMEEEKKKSDQKRQKAKEHANFLLNQMQEKSCPVGGRFGFEQMSTVEKAMNKDRLDRANNSESIQMLLRNKHLQYRLAGKQ